ncbi:MAG: hypothetical protein IPJ14_23460 [Kineosporiaceae bacterium]|nr:hypothetical protein [Kineosporiaceae bacterium]
MSEWDEVGGDPCPGDLAVITESRDFVRRVVLNGEELRDQYRGLMAGVDQLRWTGTAADATRAKGQEVLPQFFEFWSAHRDVDTALTAYLDEFVLLSNRARCAMDEYHRAVTGRNGAAEMEALHDGQARAADSQLRQLTRQYKVLQDSRAVALLRGDPVAGYDTQLRQNLAGQAAQIRLRNNAQHEAATAARSREEHEAQRRSAVATIKWIREQHDDAQKRAAHAIFLIIGFDDQDYTFAGLYDRVNRKFEKVILSDGVDAFLDACDQVGTWASAAGIICCLIPPLAPVGVVLSGVSKGLTLVVFVGRGLRQLNGSEESASDFAWAAFALFAPGNTKWIKATAKAFRGFTPLTKVARAVRLDRLDEVTRSLRRGLKIGPPSHRIKVKVDIEKIPKALRDHIPRPVRREIEKVPKVGEFVAQRVVTTGKDVMDLRDDVGDFVENPSVETGMNIGSRLVIIGDDIFGPAHPPSPKSSK